MIPRSLTLRSSLIALFATVALGHSAAAAFTPLADDFASFDSGKWTQAIVFNQGSITADGSLHVSTSSADHSMRADIISKRNDINPFTQPLQLTFNAPTISGTPGAGQNAFFAMVGNINSTANGAGNGYYPGQSPTEGAGYVSFLILKRADDFRLTIREQISGQSGVDVNYSLSSVPTALIWTLQNNVDTNTAAWSLSVTDATILVNGNWVDSISGVFATFSESHLQYGSYLAIGALNNSAVSAGTGITLDSVSVVAVPEPAVTTALIAAAICGMLVLRTRRKR